MASPADFAKDKWQGRATLVAGTVTVNTPAVRADSVITLTRGAAGGTVGIPQVGTITPGTSFVINSVQEGTASTVQTSDTGVINWRIDN